MAFYPAALPCFMIRIRPENPKFAQAYGGLPSPHRRPAVVTRWCYDEYGALRGFKFAPITSTLRIQVVSPGFDGWIGRLNFLSVILQPGQLSIGGGPVSPSLRASTTMSDRSESSSSLGTGCEPNPATSG